jgi:hypothetical protein
VKLNGSDVPRPDAAGAGGFERTAVGDVRAYEIAGRPSVDRKRGRRPYGTSVSRLYLDGLPVDGAPPVREDANVVHLDPLKFGTALLGGCGAFSTSVPDEVRSEVLKAVRGLWTERLSELRASTPQNLFLDAMLWTTLYWDGAGLLEGTDVVPNSLVRKHDAYPHFRGNELVATSPYDGPPITKLDLETGRVVVFDIWDEDGYPGDLKDWSVYMYLYKNGALSISTDGLEGYWVARALTPICGEDVTVTLDGVISTDPFVGAPESVGPVEMRVCRDCRLDGRLGSVACDNAWYGCIGPGVNSIVHVAGRGAAHVIKQLSPYCDEDGREDRKARDAAWDAYTNRVLSMERDGTGAIIQKMINASGIHGYAGVAGSSWEVSFDWDGTATVSRTKGKT